MPYQPKLTPIYHHAESAEYGVIYTISRFSNDPVAFLAWNGVQFGRAMRVQRSELRLVGDFPTVQDAIHFDLTEANQ